jgi:hypothetical protein
MFDLMEEFKQIGVELMPHTEDPVNGFCWDMLNSVSTSKYSEEMISSCNSNQPEPINPLLLAITSSYISFVIAMRSFYNSSTR